MRLTPELLQAAVGCTAANAQRFAEPLSVACAFYGIDTPVRMAAFLAQIGHESGSFRYVREIWGPTSAQAGYEGRKDLGNLMPGDGFLYRGRGLIQTTGRFNYQRVRDRLRERFPNVPDFEAEPAKLEDPQWAALSAADYWDMKGLNALADVDNFELITRRINGGLNGYADRRTRWERAKRVFAEQPQEKEVSPFIAAALPAIIEAVPKLGKLFSSGSEVSERNVKAAEVVVEVAKGAINAVNEQDLAQQLKDNPQAVVEVARAVEENWFAISEAGGGGIEGARRFNNDVASSGVPLWRQPAFVISCLVLVFPMLLAVDLFFIHPEAYDGNMRTQVITAFLGAIAVVAAFWLGSSFGSQKKDERR